MLVSHVPWTPSTTSPSPLGPRAAKCSLGSRGNRREPGPCCRRGQGSLSAVFLLLILSGCAVLPRRHVEDTVYNPFPELSRVAVVPFFNHSREPTVNGLEFARAYYLELQSIPGFEVVPVEVVQQAIVMHGLRLNGPEEVRQLASILDVDAVVIGVVTDYRPYYPPRCGLHVEWYARDPAVGPIPPGFGIPWGTRRARRVPEWVKIEAGLAWAKDMLRQHRTPQPGESSCDEAESSRGHSSASDERDAAGSGLSPGTNGHEEESRGLSSSPEMVPMLAFPEVSPGPQSGGAAMGSEVSSSEEATGRTGSALASVSISPSVAKIEPVMVHTRVFSGNDPEFTRALATYYRFREDSRFGGWQGYLERSDDFIRFCCRLHIHQMLQARGGAGKKQVVWDWPLFR